MRRTVFYISDGTGITAETIGHSVLTQFDRVEWDSLRIPFVDSADKAEIAATRIRQQGERDGVRPVVINTVVDPALTAILSGSGALMLDVFAPFIGPLEDELGTKRSPRVGKAHGLTNFAEYEARINATNYALSHDDGVDVNYSDAEVILVGVSRVGKTPTCLYLALHFGVKAGNYPLTPEDLEAQELPSRLKPHRAKLFGLTIQPERLREIREERRPGSKYASLDNCRTEVREAEALMVRENITMLDTTTKSIEEISTTILHRAKLTRHVW